MSPKVVKEISSHIAYGKNERTQKDKRKGQGDDPGKDERALFHGNYRNIVNSFYCWRIQKCYMVTSYASLDFFILIL